jgi:hypothetical protein
VNLPEKVTVHFERRSDGGLRCWSDDVPGLVLSHSDPRLVLADVIPALELLLSHRQDSPVQSSRRPDRARDE